MTAQLLHGDCLELMQAIPDGSVDLTVTSPPYDNLRTYNGFTFDFEGIARELYRVTKQGGVVVWVVGDATVKGSETGTSFRQALYFRDVCGFNLHDTMIWTKDGGGAVGSNYCYTQNHEFMFVFSKARPATVNLIRDKPNQSAGKDKSGIGRRKASGKHKVEVRTLCSALSKRNNWWYIPPQRGQHPAVFPERLAADHIASWSNPGDLVLDPFLGSGTTGKMAVQMGRNFIGIEISAEYLSIASDRINGAQQQLRMIA